MGRRVLPRLYDPLHERDAAEVIKVINRSVMYDLVDVLSRVTVGST